MKGLRAKIGKVRTTTEAVVRLLWVDYVFLAALGIAVIGMQFVDITRTKYRRFPMWPVNDIAADDGGIRLRGPVEYSYPDRDPILSTISAFLIVSIVPQVTFLAFQIALRSFWDFTISTIGSTKALLIATFVQSFLKIVVGGFRPIFLAVCKPVAKDLAQYEYINGVYWLPLDVCHIDPEDLRTTSFPSGHTASAFAAGLFLSLYINGKMKTFSDFAPDFWTLFVTLIPLFGAAIISSHFLVDHHHHPEDVIVGVIIGVLSAFIAYRVSYASIFDFRYNHIPLPRYCLHIRYAYDVARKPEDTTKTPMDARSEFSNRLVVPGWWGPAGQKASHKDEPWLKMMTSVAKTDTKIIPSRGSLTEKTFRSNNARPPVDTSPPSPSGGRSMSDGVVDEEQPVPLRAHLARVDEESIENSSV